MSKRIKTKFVQVTIRRIAREKLKKIAEREKRSMSKQIELWVENYERN